MGPYNIIDFDSQEIYEILEKNKIAMCVKDIANLSKYSRQEVYQILNKLISSECVVKKYLKKENLNIYELNKQRRKNDIR